LIIVTWLPRATVRACGQTWLFWITIVFAFELGVHEPVGLAGDDELPPHAAAMASAAATAPPATRVLRLDMRLFSLSLSDRALRF